MSVTTSTRGLRVAFLTRYASLGASSRVRALQYLPSLQEADIKATVYPLLPNTYVEHLYRGERVWGDVLRAYSRRLLDCMRLARYDVVWLEKELMPMLPYALEAFLLGRCRLVLDLDDAIFHNYDLSKSTTVQHLLGNKIDRLMQRATLVTAGNGYLAGRARRAGALWVEQIPSTVPMSRYDSSIVKRTPRGQGHPMKIVWIGSPATVHYLELVRTPLLQISERRAISLHVIGAPAPQWPGLQTESIRWSEAGEAAALAACDVGIMPLADTPWEQGKCSFKLIQYMACGLPVLASPVGMNRDVVRPGLNGLLATNDDEWHQALDRLFEQPELCFAMGQQGRRDVESLYSTEVVGKQLVALLKRAAGTPKAHAAIG